MLYFTNYRAQAKGLYAESPYQLMALTLADVVTTTRELGKIGIVVGAVASAVTPLFGNTSYVPLVAACISAAAWLGCRRLAKTFELKWLAKTGHEMD